MALVAAAVPTLSCAKLPPGQTNLSGRRIHVVMRFASQPQANFYYFFCINKYGTQGTSGANGPVAVLGPAVSQNAGYGNGFVTGSSANTTGSISGLPDYGVTDFVLYNSSVPNGIGLYHFTANPNQQTLGQLIPTKPLNAVLPTNASVDDATGQRTIAFDIDMVQLVTDQPTTALAIAEAQKIQYLQVNIIATNVVPMTQTFPGLKEVDAMGDGTDTSQYSIFLQINLNQANSYLSTTGFGQLSPEPTGDVYPLNDHPDQQSLDLEYWEVDVQPHS